MDWLNGLARGSLRPYTLGYETFVEFMDETTGKKWTLKKFVKAREKDLKERSFWFELKVVEFYEWMATYVTHEKIVTSVRPHPVSKKPTTFDMHFKGGNKLSDSTRANYVSAIRSMFNFYRLDLMFTRMQRRTIGKRPKPVYTDYLFEQSDFERMKQVGNPQERYISLAGKDLGLRAVDFASLDQGRFANALGKEPPVFIGKVYTVKEGVWAYPLLTQDGLEAARDWLRILASNRKRNDKAPMLNIKNKELTPNLKRLTEKAGIETHGQRVRFHCMRKFLIDRLSLRMSESKWKQIVGKEISESAYVSPLELRECYSSVLEYIAIPSGRMEGLTRGDIEKLKRILQLVNDGKIKIQV